MSVLEDSPKRRPQRLVTHARPNHPTGAWLNGVVCCVLDGEWMVSMPH